MTAEQLMKPRFKVIADYPGNHIEIGTVIAEDYGRNHYDAPNEFEKYPAIFKKLEWWEERSIEDMPEFLKETEPIENDTIVYVYRRQRDFMYTQRIFIRLTLPDDTRKIRLEYLEPATKEEYEVYINRK